MPKESDMEAKPMLNSLSLALTCKSRKELLLNSKTLQKDSLRASVFLKSFYSLTTTEIISSSGKNDARTGANFTEKEETYCLMNYVKRIDIGRST